MMEVHPPHAMTLKRRPLLLNLTTLILSLYRSHLHVLLLQSLIHSQKLATCMHASLDPLPPTHKDQSACTDDCVHFPTHTIGMPINSFDSRRSPENTPSSSSAYSPTHVVLTTFDEHDNSDLKTTLAASISRLVKVDEKILKEFDELRSTLKEAKKTRYRPKNLKDKVERYKVLSAKISLQVLAKRTQLDDAVRKYEHQYFLKHGQLPKRDPSYTDLIKERNLAKGVLRTLNISL